MPNRKNLIPNSERTPSELREMTRKGGIASGRARRRKANLKRTMEEMLQLELPEGKLKKQLADLGVEADLTMEQGLVFSLLINGINKGNPQAFETIKKTIGQDTTLQDRQEQRARTEKLKAETERAKAMLEPEIETGDDGFLEVLEQKTEEVWQDDEESS